MNFANKNNEQILKEIVRWQDSDIHFKLSKWSENI